MTHPPEWFIEETMVDLGLGRYVGGCWMSPLLQSSLLGRWRGTGKADR